MESTAGEPAKDGSQQGTKDIKADELRASRSGSVSAEVVRLQNFIKAKDKELDDVRKEVVALKATLSTKDRALHQSEQELRLLKERNVATEGELANMAKELAVLKVDKRKLEAQLAGLARKGEKEQSMSTLTAYDRAAANGANDGGGAFGSLPSSEHVAALQSDLRSARLDGEKAAEGVKVLENLLRAKDKHINGLQRKADEAEVYRIKCADLENRLLEMNRQMDEMRAAGRAAADVQRLRDAENTRLTADLAKARAALDSAQDAAARSSAALKAFEMRCTALEQEVGTLVGQLARTSAVAQRVAASEVKAGCKDEGVVHVTRHLEEIRFMGGEIARLQQRVSSLEKELAVADELKERYRRASQAGGSSQDSAGASPCPTPGPRPSSSGPTSRPTSRPVSAPRRPVSASTTSLRPNSAPRARSAVRMSTGSVLTGITAASPSAATGTNAVGAALGSPVAAAAGATGPSPTVRSSLAGSARRVSRPQPWNTPSSPGKPVLTSPRPTPASPAAAAVAGSEAAGSKAKPAPQAKWSPKLPGTTFGRPQSAGSGPAAAAAAKKAAGVAAASPRTATTRGTAAGGATPRSAAAAAPAPAAAASSDSAASQTATAPAVADAIPVAGPAEANELASTVVEASTPGAAEVADAAGEAVAEAEADAAIEAEA